VRTHVNLVQREIPRGNCPQADELLFDRMLNLLSIGKPEFAEIRVTPDRVATVSWQRAIVNFSIAQGSAYLLAHSKDLLGR
jgi:hypothetical protein